MNKTYIEKAIIENEKELEKYNLSYLEVLHNKYYRNKDLTDEDRDEINFITGRLNILYSLAEKENN